MDEIVKNRLQEVVPVNELKDLDVDEVILDTKIAFKIIGYTPKDFDKAINNAWDESNAIMLSEFIYDVWRLDK